MDLYRAARCEVEDLAPYEAIRTDGIAARAIALRRRIRFQTFQRQGRSSLRNAQVGTNLGMKPDETGGFTEIEDTF